MLLITPEQVIDIAFMKREIISPEAIRPVKIDIAQEHFIRPRLGNRMFESLTAGANPDFVDRYIKPALAHYVRYGIVDEIAVQFSDNGAIVYRSSVSENTELVSKEDSQDKTVTNESQASDNGDNTVTQTDSTTTISTDAVSSEGTQTDDGYNCINSSDLANTNATKEDEKAINRTELSKKSISTSATTSDQQVLSQSSTSEASVTNKNLREASPIEKRILLQRSLSDANILLAKAVRYVEANTGEFPLYVPSNFSKTIFY